MLLPPENEVAEGNVFTPVCDSVHKRAVSVQGCLCTGVGWGVSVWGGVCPGGLSSEGSLSGGFSVQEGLCPGGSLSGGDLCPGWVSVQGGLCHGEPPQYSGRAGGRYHTGIILVLKLVSNVRQLTYPANEIGFNLKLYVFIPITLHGTGTRTGNRTGTIGKNGCQPCFGPV